MTLAERIRQAQRDAYLDGLRDGVETVLDQLDGSNRAVVPEGIYQGAMPQDLVEWIATVRRRQKEERAAAHADDRSAAA